MLLLHHYKYRKYKRPYQWRNPHKHINSTSIVLDRSWSEYEQFLNTTVTIYQTQHHQLLASAKKVSRFGALMDPDRSRVLHASTTTDWYYTSQPPIHTVTPRALQWESLVRHEDGTARITESCRQFTAVWTGKLVIKTNRKLAHIRIQAKNGKSFNPWRPLHQLKRVNCNWKQWSKSSTMASLTHILVEQEPS